MKVSEFDKQQLVDHMKSNGEINRPNEDSESWKRAFKLYKENQGVSVSMDCSRCWDRVSQWLRN